MWFSSIYKSEESGLLGASFEPLPEEASIVFPPCGSLLEWWSNAKYQILSTKSQGFRCRVSMLRIQVSGVGCQEKKHRSWNVLERSGNPVWSEAAAGNTETWHLSLYDLGSLFLQYSKTARNLYRQSHSTLTPAGRDRGLSLRTRFPGCNDATTSPKNGNFFPFCYLYFPILNS